MRLYQNKNSTQCVILIGLGLVGKAIANQLDSNYYCLDKIKLNWNLFESNLPELNDLYSKAVKTRGNIHIIWSAGKAGFNSGVEEINLEFSFFESMHSLFHQIYIELQSESKISYSLISSAGALFEGQTLITRDHAESGKRPYADLKLKQEEYIKTRHWIELFYILRLSSVYSRDNLSGRLGLIATVMYNGLHNKEVTIFGSETTLRDYVLDFDIGRYVYEIVSNQIELTSGIYYLISGKPSSIKEISELVQRIIGKKLYLKYQLKGSNSLNITFSKRIKAPSFVTSHLHPNLKVLYTKLLNQP